MLCEMAQSIAMRLLLYSQSLFTGDRAASQEQHVGQQILEVDASTHREALLAFDNVRPMEAAQPIAGQTRDRSKWGVDCDSQQPPFNCSNVFDDNRFSFWRSSNTTWPHVLTVDLKVPFTVSAISMLPFQRDLGTFEGNIATHEVYVSLNGKDWGMPVAYGTWWKDNTGRPDSSG